MHEDSIDFMSNSKHVWMLTNNSKFRGFHHRTSYRRLVCSIFIFMIWNNSNIILLSTNVLWLSHFELSQNHPWTRKHGNFPGPLVSVLGTCLVRQAVGKQTRLGSVRFFYFIYFFGIMNTSGHVVDTGGHGEHSRVKNVNVSWGKNCNIF